MKIDEEVKRAILNYLNEKCKECTISEIAENTGYSRSTVSKYLKVLEAEGKVKRREQLPYIYYFLCGKRGG